MLHCFGGVRLVMLLFLATLKTHFCQIINLVGAKRKTDIGIGFEKPDKCISNLLVGVILAIEPKGNPFQVQHTFSLMFSDLEKLTSENKVELGDYCSHSLLSVTFFILVTSSKI